jgi:hypothetical protein
MELYVFSKNISLVCDGDIDILGFSMQIYVFFNDNSSVCNVTLCVLIDILVVVMDLYTFSMIFHQFVM